jgi:hypothetical protein
MVERNLPGGIVKAYVLIVSKNPNEVMPMLQGFDGYEEITGPYDLLVTLEGYDTLEELAVAFNVIRNIEGVERTVPCIVLSS